MHENQLPGTTEQQRVIQLISDFYAADRRILAIGLFGSLARGNWDKFSDLDLDIVIRDDVQIDIQDELAKLGGFLHPMGEEPLLMIADRPDAGDVVLASLVQFSIRYHPLATTNWKIVDSLQLLHGPLDLATVVAAGQANRGSVTTTKPVALLDRYLRYALGVTIELQRGRLWLAVELLHRMRTLLMELYAATRGYVRAIQSFEAHAAPGLQNRLAAMLPQAERRSVLRCLERGIDLLTEELAGFTDSQVILTTAQHSLLRKLRQCCTELKQREQTYHEDSTTGRA
ncbi:MAG: nucleotidyltransferase domain-containing protein [Caldilineaceae bacterium]